MQICRESATRVSGTEIKREKRKRNYAREASGLVVGEHGFCLNCATANLVTNSGPRHNLHDSDVRFWYYLCKYAGNPNNTCKLNRKKQGEKKKN